MGFCSLENWKMWKCFEKVERTNEIRALNYQITQPFLLNLLRCFQPSSQLSLVSVVDLFFDSAGVMT